MVYYETCPNEDTIRLILWALAFTIAMLIFFIWIVKKLCNYCDELYVKYKLLQNNFELNSIISYEYIQEKLCPYDLITFNNEHIFKLEKCEKCNKQCKKECWIKYFIDKIKDKKY